jgi:hypothetical protein
MKRERLTQDSSVAQLLLKIGILLPIFQTQFSTVYLLLSVVGECAKNVPLNKKALFS